MKKILSFSIILSLFFCMFVLFTNINTINAQYTSDTFKEVENVLQKDLAGGVTLYKDKVTTSYNGTGVSVDGRLTDYWNNHTIQWVDLPSVNNGVKVVTWSEGSANKWKQSTVRGTIADFERKNPGYKVIAGVNGDFFKNSKNADIPGDEITFEPTGFYIQAGGEVYRPCHAGGEVRKTVGWKKDGTVIVGNPTIESNMTLHIGDVEVPITGIEDVPRDGGVGILTVKTTRKFNLEGYTVYKAKNIAFRIAHANGKYFLKGEIVGKEEALSSVQTKEGYFYLVAKDNSLDGIKENQVVTAQYDLTGDWADVDSGVGYIHQFLKDGEILYQGNTTDDFVYTTHPRTLVGFKEDGSTVMMVVDGRGLSSEFLDGASFYQCGEFMKRAGCVNAFNLDGGGSSTLVVRNEKGGFDVINTPSDGQERSVGNAVLFVMEDPGISVDNDYSERTSVKINVADMSILRNVVAEVNGQQIPVENNSLIINNLEENKTHAVKVKYEIRDPQNEGKWLKSETIVYPETAPFVMPASGIKVDLTSITDVSFKIVKEDLGYANNVRNVVITVGDNTYQMGDASEFTVSDLIIDSEYTVSISYEIYDEISGKLYPGTIDPFVIKTAAFESPKIKSFENKGIIGEEYVFRYGYSDADDRVTKAYVSVNGKEYEVKSKSGSLKIAEADIDLTSSSYTIKLVLEYTNDENQTIKVESENIILEQIEAPKKGCKKKKLETMILLTSMIAVAGIVIRKKD